MNLKVVASGQHSPAYKTDINVEMTYFYVSFLRLYFYLKIYLIFNHFFLDSVNLDFSIIASFFSKNR